MFQIYKKVRKEGSGEMLPCAKLGIFEGRMEGRGAAKLSLPNLS